MFHEDRFRNHDIDNLTALGLVDAVDGISARAGAIVEALQIAVENQTGQVEPDVMYHSLEAVGLEIADIREVE